MYHVSVQGVNENMINVHYYYHHQKYCYYEEGSVTFSKSKLVFTVTTKKGS